jgi:small-conductance mechanosensitive channel
VTDVLTRLATIVLGCGASLLAVELVHRILVRIGRRVLLVKDLTRRAHRPFELLTLTAAADVGTRVSGLHGGWLSPVVHALDLAVIAATGWLVTGLVFVAEDVWLARFRTDVRDNRYARTVHTQVRVVRRVTAVAVTVLTLGTMLTTFREVRIIGTSVLASAGVVAAVAAFAAQALLGNVFAGLQIAFGKSLRLDDVVVIDNEWGRVEEITLTYVVVHVWDDRRLILPTSYFTTHPFQNWTRSEASLLGSVEFEVDWTVPVEEMREQLRAVLTDSPLWDKRVSVLQVTEACGGFVRLRALVSASDAPTLWDLRCLVREQLVCWLREHHPGALPRVRAEVGAELNQPIVGVPTTTTSRREGDARVFGGDIAGWRRRREFTGPEAT